MLKFKNNINKDNNELVNKINLNYINKLVNKINLDYINYRIDKEFCNNTIKQLKDINLLDKYKETKSVQNKIKEIELLMKECDIESNKRELFINMYMLKLIPAGTKGDKRGKKFNNIVQNTINNLKLDNNRFKICFEEKCSLCITDEKPDWYILEKSTGKVIIGMNQLDLWSGGAQSNRGFKYLIDNKHNTNKSKLLCIICNYKKFINNKNKIYKLFEVGFLNDTLCYIKNIEKIINEFFN